jgi:hypothetical protein
MKLPREVSTGVAQQISPDRNLLQNTLTVQSAQNKIINQLGGMALGAEMARETTKLTSAMGAAAQEYDKMTAYIKNRDAIDLANDPYVSDELRGELLERYDLELDENGQAYVPAFEVRGAIHDYHVKEIQNAAHKALGKKSLNTEFDNALIARTAKGAASLVELDTKQEVAQMAASGDVLYAQAVQAGDLDQAARVIDNMFKAGLWDSDKTAEHVKNVVGDIQYHSALQEVVGGDATTVRGVQALLGSDDIKMTDSQ